MRDSPRKVSRRFIVAVSAAILLSLAPAMPSGIAGAQEAGSEESTYADGELLALARSSGLPATLNDGDCIDAGAVVAEFSSAEAPCGSNVGSAEANAAATSFTTLALPFEAILAADHAVMVSGPDGLPLACGVVGGVPTADGSLAFGLEEEIGSGVFGIAYFSPGADGVSTGASLFLAVPGDPSQAAEGEREAEVVGDLDPAEPAAAEVAVIDSGGLGLPIGEFYARYGEAVPDTVMYGEVIPTANGRIRVGAANNDRVNSVTRYFDQGVAFEEARATGLGFAPADSVLVQSYTTSVGSTADLYYSAALATQFAETEDIDGMEFPTWVNGEPGQFIIGYGGYNPANGVNEVTRIVMALGNNP